MTIYTIVNDLIDESSGSLNDDAIWSILSPAAILQGGNPYFVPDFSTRFEARSAVAVRIGRLGKGIARRFASRYVDAIAPALLFVASELLERLREKGLPWTPAINYDRCLAIGRFRNVPYQEIPDSRIGLKIKDKDNHVIAEKVESLVSIDIGAVIEMLSRDNTFKTGDIILVATGGHGPTASPGFCATLTLDGEDSLRFNIR